MVNSSKRVDIIIRFTILLLHISRNKTAPLWLLKNPLLFAFMLTRLCEVRDSLFLCDVKTHSHTHWGRLIVFFFSLFLNSSLQSGCLVNEGRELVYFMMEIAEPISRRSSVSLNIVQKQISCKWEEKSVHCSKICLKVLWKPANYVRPHQKEWSLFYYDERKSLPVDCPS